MAIRIRTVRNTDELATALGAIGHYFGWEPMAEHVEPWTSYLPLDRMHAALDDGAIIGGAGVFPFEMTVPGRPIPCAGVTVVGVHPTHRCPLATPRHTNSFSPGNLPSCTAGELATHLDGQVTLPSGRRHRRCPAAHSRTLSPPGRYTALSELSRCCGRADARPHVRSFSYTATPCPRPQQHARHRQPDDPAADDDSRHYGH